MNAGDGSRPGLAIVIVNYGPPELLETNLALMDVDDAAIHVVDNWTTRQNRQAVRDLCSRYGWIGHYPRGNLGFGVGCNVAAAAAIELGADRLLFLNPDARIDAESIDRLSRQVRADPLCLTAPVVCTEEGAIWSAGVDLYLSTGSMRSWAKRPDPLEDEVIPWLTGACLLLSTELWQKVGGFDPDYFLYWEDVDLSHRVHQAGGRLALVGSARAVHAEGSTHTQQGGDRAKSPIYYYYNIRNRMVFAAKHLPAEQVKRWKRTALVEAYRVLLRGGRRQFLKPGRSWWPALRGVVDGSRWSRRQASGGPAAS